MCFKKFNFLLKIILKKDECDEVDALRLLIRNERLRCKNKYGRTCCKDILKKLNTNLDSSFIGS